MGPRLFRRGNEEDVTAGEYPIVLQWGRAFSDAEIWYVPAANTVTF